MRSSELEKRTELVAIEPVDALIRVIRGQRVILDIDLAGIYGVPTKRLNEQVKRNTERFPKDSLNDLFSNSLCFKKAKNAFSME